MDIALHMIDQPSGAPPRFDLSLSGADLATDEGLQTAVIVSLFTDRRASADDDIPDDASDRRGWWADKWPGEPGDQIGSRLWLLGREKQLTAVLKRAREYAEEALQWLIDDGIASRVEITAYDVRRGVLGMNIRIDRPTKGVAIYNFSYLWESL